jgi:hypothetical protein
VTTLSLSLSLSLSTLRSALPPLAREALDAATDLGCDHSPLELYRWAERKSVDPIRSEAQQKAARLIMSRLAELALAGCTWEVDRG